VNAQIAIWGVAEAFDAWAESGCEGWSREEVLPLFAKLEDDPVMAGVAHHGQGGPIPVYRAPLETWGPVDKALREAALACGYPWNPDLNDPDKEGVSNYPINSRNFERVTTNDGYLEPARNRANLTIRGGALVEKIVVEDGRAVAVRVMLDGEWQEIRAREIVLSSGAIHSPAILLRSGLGPAAELSALGIPVVADMPHVGKHFHDHAICRTNLALKPEYVSKDPKQRHTNSCVTYTSGLGGGGFRDMIFIGFNHRYLGAGDLPGPMGGVAAGIYDVFSRGELTLASADPRIDPIVEENMLSDQRDVIRMRDAVRRLAELAAQPALTQIAERFQLRGIRPVDRPGGVAADRRAGCAHAGSGQRHAARRRHLQNDRLRGSARRGGSGSEGEGAGRPARRRRLHHALRLPGQHPFHLRDDRRVAGAEDEGGGRGLTPGRKSRRIPNASYTLRLHPS
jgi:hypothetical protein